MFSSKLLTAVLASSLLASTGFAQTRAAKPAVEKEARERLEKRQLDLKRDLDKVTSVDAARREEIGRAILKIKSEALVEAAGKELKTVEEIKRNIVSLPEAKRAEMNSAVDSYLLARTQLIAEASRFDKVNSVDSRIMKEVLDEATSVTSPNADMLKAATKIYGNAVSKMKEAGFEAKGNPIGRAVLKSAQEFFEKEKGKKVTASTKSEFLELLRCLLGSGAAA